MKKNRIIIFYNKNKIGMKNAAETLAAELGPLYDDVMTTSEISREMLSAPEKNSPVRIVVLGGDGTINHLVNKLFTLKQADSSLTTLPELILSNMGTGSDYIKSVYGKANASQWRKYLLENKLRARPVDVGLISGTAANGKFHQYFINILGVGISGEVVLDKNKNEKNILMSKIPNSLAYVLPAIKNILSYQPTKTHVKINGEKYTMPLKACFIAKGSYSGGGMKFGAHANLFDGEFDMTLVGNMGLLDLFHNLKNVLSNDVAKDNKVLSMKSRQIECQFESPISIEYDGELLLGVKELKAEILNAALPVCFNPEYGV